MNLAAQAGVRYSITNPDVYIQSNIIGFFLTSWRLVATIRWTILFMHHLVRFMEQIEIPFSEKDLVDNPLSLYAAIKIYRTDGLYLQPSLPDTSGLRFFTVYGPMGRPDMAYFSFTQKILSGQAIQVFNHGVMERDFTYIDDVVEGVVRVISKPPEEGQGRARHRIFNIGNNNPVKLIVFIETLEKALSKAIGRKITVKKELLPMQPGDVPRTYADTTLLEQTVGFKPLTSIVVGLTKFAEWYCDYYGLR